MSRPNQLKKIFLNLGCGARYNSEWINLDQTVSGKEVVSHNLLEKLPFHDNSVDFIYSSHVLEHFRKSDASIILSECFRILVPGGSARIVVPDFEAMARIYLAKLKESIEGDKSAQADYDWILLEIFDQMVRDKQGGEMQEYLTNPVIPNKDFIIQRTGSDGLQYFNRKQAVVSEDTNKNIETETGGINFFKRLFRRLLNSPENELLKIGRFRRRGEIHMWMYDRFSLERVLKKAGFVDIKIQTAFSSILPDWVRYNLDTDPDGSVYKPSSLYMEAQKPL